MCVTAAGREISASVLCDSVKRGNCVSWAVGRGDSPVGNIIYVLASMLVCTIAVFVSRRLAQTARATGFNKMLCHFCGNRAAPILIRSGCRRADDKLTMTRRGQRRALFQRSNFSINLFPTQSGGTRLTFGMVLVPALVISRAICK